MKLLIICTTTSNNNNNNNSNTVNLPANIVDFRGSTRALSEYTGVEF